MDQESYSPDLDLVQRTRWYIKIRWYFLSVMAISGLGSLFVGSGWNSSLARDTLISTLALSTNALFFAVSRRPFRKLRMRRVVAVMLATDLLLVTIWIFVKSGIESRMLVIYALPILMAVILGRRAVYATTAGAVLLYDSMLILDHLGIIHSIGNLTRLRSDPAYVLNSVVFFGGVIALIGILADFVTRQLQKKEQQAIATAQALERAQTIAKVGNWEWDVTSDKVTGSKEWYRIFSITKHQAGQLTYDTALSKVHPDDRKRVDDKIRACVRRRRPFQLEFRLVTRRQHIRHVRSEARLQLSKEGIPVKLFGTAQDITDEKSLDDAKNEFVALASHQLRTPATSVKILLSLLKDGYSGDLPETQRRVISQAYDANERELHIINNVLHAAQLDMQRIKLKQHRINLITIITKTIVDYEQIAQAKNQTISRLLPSEAVEVRGDPTYLYMVFENLLSNASKYTPDGGHIIIAVSATSRNVRISVSDNGIGINRESSAQVYDKFKRLKNSATDVTEGSGLGLYLTKHIVELHKGRIKLSSKPASGTTFTVTLPKA